MVTFPILPRARHPRGSALLIALLALPVALGGIPANAPAQAAADGSKEALRARAEAVAEDLLARTKSHGAGDTKVQDLRVELGGILLRLGEPKKAAEVLLAAEAERAKRLSPTDETLVRVRCMIATARKDEGKPEKGTEFLRKKMRDLPEPDPAKSAESRLALASALELYAVELHGLKAYEEAGKRFATCYRIRLAELGESDVRTLHSAIGVGACEIELDRHESARVILERTLALAREHHPGNTGLIQLIQGNLGVLHAGTGDRDQALALAEAALAALEEEGVAKDDDAYLLALENLAKALAGVGRIEEALARLESLLASLEAARPKSRWKERIEGLEAIRKAWRNRPPPPTGPPSPEPPPPPEENEPPGDPPADPLPQPGGR